MATSVLTFEETVSGERVAGATLDFPTTQITLRELVRARVYEETRNHNRKVQEFEAALQANNRGGEMSETERQLNTEIAVKRAIGAVKLKELNWEEQYDLALRAFERNRYFVIVGDRQVETLDSPIQLGVGTEVTFLKLIPLAGG